MDTSTDFLKHAIQWSGRLRERSGWYTPKKITGPCGEYDCMQLEDCLSADFSISVQQFHPLYTPTDGDIMLGKLMLVVSEVSEAAESVRQGDLVHFSEEIADVYIRLNDIVSALSIDIEAEITKKMKKNEQRPVKHGKLTNL